MSGGALAFAAGETHARRLKAPALRDNEAAFFVEVTRKDIHNGKKRKVAGVVAVSGRVPAVVGHTAPGEELTCNAGDDGGGNPCDFRGFRGRPLVRHPLKGREHRFGIKGLAVGGGDGALPVNVRHHAFRFGKALHRPLFVFDNAHRRKSGFSRVRHNPRVSRGSLD